MIGICRHDATVHEAIRTGEWTPDLEQHVSGCTRCAEAVALSRLLHAMPPPTPSPRTADVAWWQARLAARTDPVERFLGPLEVLQTVAVTTVGALGLAALIQRLWPAVADLRVPAGLIPDPGAIPDVFWFGAALLISLAAVVADQVWDNA